MRVVKFVALFAAICGMLCGGASQVSAQVITQGLPPFEFNTHEAAIVDSSAQVLREIMTIPGKGIPATLLAKSEGIVIVPGMLKGGFVTGGRQATAMLDSYGGNPPRWGIDDVDGKNLRDGNPTNNPGLRLTLDQKKTVRIEVRRGGVRVFVEAEKVVDWQGRPEQLSTNFWNVEKKQSLFLGSQARFHVHKLTLTPR